MTYEDICNLIKAIAGFLGVPWAYLQFENKTSPPFLTYRFPQNDDFFADNVNYQGITALDIYYCSDEKDIAAETAIETFLKNNEIAYTKQESYIDTDAMWQILYSTEVIINAEQG